MILPKFLAYGKAVGQHCRAIAYGFPSHRFGLVLADFGGSGPIWLRLGERLRSKFALTVSYAIALSTLASAARRLASALGRDNTPRSSRR